MNSRQLQKLGVPAHCVNEAIAAIQSAIKTGASKSKAVKQRIQSVLDEPEKFLTDEHFGPFAQAVIEDRDFVRAEPVSYQTWGKEGIDEGGSNFGPGQVPEDRAEQATLSPKVGWQGLIHAHEDGPFEQNAPLPGVPVRKGACEHVYSRNWPRRVDIV